MKKNTIKKEKDYISKFIDNEAYEFHIFLKKINFRKDALHEHSVEDEIKFAHNGYLIKIKRDFNFNEDMIDSVSIDYYLYKIEKNKSESEYPLIKKWNNIINSPQKERRLKIEKLGLV